jgi:hypothetical protein
MRHRWSVALLVLVSAVGVYAAQSKTAGAADVLPVAVGDTITIIQNPGQDRECRVEEIRGLFVRCQGPHRATETWVNMAQASGFTRSSTR